MTKPGRTVKAGIWTISGKLFARLFDFVLLLIFSRILTPEDFGLVALAMAPIYIGEAVLAFPLVQALLRIKSPAPEIYDTAFTLSILRGLALAVVFLSISIPFANFYSEPRLTALIAALAIAPILRGTISPRMVVFMRNMDFRREFALDIVGKASAFAIATTLAITAQTYWAIAAATIMTPLAMNVLSYILAPYRPRFTLSGWKYFADMIGWNTLSQIIQATNWQLVRILLGRFVPTESLGRYSISDDLLSIPIRAVIAPLSRPLMANYSMHSNPAGLVTAFKISQNTIVTLMIPVFLSISFLAELIVYVLFGDQWISAAPILRWLSLSAIISLPVATFSPLALSLDQTRYDTLRGAIEFSVKIPSLIIGVYYYGIPGALVAVILGAAASFTANLFLVRKLIGISIRVQIHNLMRPWLSMLVMALVLWASLTYLLDPSLSSKISLFFEGILIGFFGLFAYFGTLYLLWKKEGQPQGFESKFLDILKSTPSNLRR